jgi:hypothetical protein
MNVQVLYTGVNHKWNTSSTDIHTRRLVFYDVAGKELCRLMGPANFDGLSHKIRKPENRLVHAAKPILSILRLEFYVMSKLKYIAFPPLLSSSWNKETARTRTLPLTSSHSTKIPTFFSPGFPRKTLKRFNNDKIQVFSRRRRVPRQKPKIAFSNTLTNFKTKLFRQYHTYIHHNEILNCCKLSRVGVCLFCWTFPQHTRG